VCSSSWRLEDSEQLYSGNKASADTIWSIWTYSFTLWIYFLCICLNSENPKDRLATYNQMNPWGGFWVARMLRSCLACSTHLLTCSMKVKCASYNNNMMTMMDNGCYHCGEVEDVRCIVGFSGKWGMGIGACPVCRGYPCPLSLRTQPWWLPYAYINPSGWTSTRETCERSRSKTLSAHLGNVLGTDHPGQMGITTSSEIVHLCTEYKLVYQPCSWSRVA